MSTRLYTADLATTAPPAYLIPFDAAWDVTGNAVRRLIQGVAPSLGGTSESIAPTKGAVAGPVNVLAVQMQLEGLAAQTITGTVKGQTRMSESNALADMYLQMIARVVDPITNTVRGTLISPLSVAVSGTPGAEGYELATTLTNRKMPSGWSGAGASVSSVTAQRGDVLVIELGARVNEVAATTRTFTLALFRSFPTTTDFPEDETTTSSQNTWIEFSHDILFDQEATVYGGYENVLFQSGLGQAPATEGQVWPRGNRGV
jgi:hypothetical protein